MILLVLFIFTYIHCATPGFRTELASNPSNSFALVSPADYLAALQQKRPAPRITPVDIGANLLSRGEVDYYTLFQSVRFSEEQQLAILDKASKRAMATIHQNKDHTLKPLEEKILSYDLQMFREKPCKFDELAQTILPLTQSSSPSNVFNLPNEQHLTLVEYTKKRQAWLNLICTLIECIHPAFFSMESIIHHLAGSITQLEIVNTLKALGKSWLLDEKRSSQTYSMVNASSPTPHTVALNKAISNTSLLLDSSEDKAARYGFIGDLVARYSPHIRITDTLKSLEITPEEVQDFSTQLKQCSPAYRPYKSAQPSDKTKKEIDKIKKELQR